MTMTIDAFKRHVLPALRARHGSGDPLAKAAGEFIADTPITDEEGNTIDVDVLALDDSGDSIPDTPEHGSAATVDRLVKESLARLKKPAKSGAFLHGSDSPTGNVDGFSTMGEFALAVHKASARGGTVDPRLIAKAPTNYAYEGAGGSGGFLVPQQWSDRLWQIVLGDEALISRTNQIPTSRNSLSLPVSETTPWGSAGVQAYWVDETSQLTTSKPSFQYRNLRLHKLAALVPASDELIEDTTALDAFIVGEAARAIRYKVDDAIVNGDGVGKPLGILQSDALVTVAKETSQTADTVVAANVAKMYARMPATSIPSAVWLINQDVLPQLLTMTLGNQAVYMPPTSLAGTPFGTLFGRPIVLSQHAKTVGDPGDIMFVDLQQYLTLTRRSGVESTSSIHLWFDYDMTAFRFTFRVAGQPWLASSITPDNSTSALSPFVALAARA